ncbi:MAG: hypothetical protein GC162_19450 [Planctomycetes bacterium]|nr:hypothetical protein [Planctomycetota bacterium]
MDVKRHGRVAGCGIGPGGASGWAGGMRAAMGLCVLLAMGPGAKGAQTFYVDFVGPGTAAPDEMYTYSAPQIEFVIDYLNTRFMQHGMTFIAGERPDAELFSASLITLNTPGSSSGAEHIDFRNEDHHDHADINAYTTFTTFLGVASPSASDMAIGTANLIGHEAEHLMGMRHHDALTPVGAGLGAGIVPGDFSPSYPGPSGATGSGITFADLHAGGSLSYATLTSDLYVGERTAARLAAAQFPFTHTDETATMNHMVSTAMEVPTPLIALPYPYRPPTPPGEAELVALNVNMASVSGMLDPIPDTGAFMGDYYKFFGSAGQRWTIEAMSYLLEEASRYADNADVAIALLDGRTGLPSEGELIGYYSGSALNDDDDDKAPGGGSYLGSTLLDVILPYTGSYVIEVFAAGPSLGLGKPGTDGGSYELFLYNTAPVAIPEPTSAMLLTIGALTLARRPKRSPSGRG